MSTRPEGFLDLDKILLIFGGAPFILLYSCLAITLRTYSTTLHTHQQVHHPIMIDFGNFRRCWMLGIPTWINCINESMLKWVNEYTCVRFMFVPRKPWHFGNEYHDAGCCDSDIVWAVDLREGKD